MKRLFILLILILLACLLSDSVLAASPEADLIGVDRFEHSQPEAALERFQALYDGTERLIGVNNSYGISCLERVAAAAGQAGQKTVAAAAMEAMRRTAREAFEENSAMALAVERIVKA